MTAVPQGVPSVRRAALLGPIATAAAAVGGLVTVGLVDPAKGGAYLRCPLYSMTGIWCPGCGMTRAAHHLATGHPLAALGSNLLLPVFAALAFGAWFTWLQTARGRGLPAWPARAPRWSWAAIGVAMIVFTVLRNISVTPFDALAP
jgi:hypothetical protein